MRYGNVLMPYTNRSRENLLREGFAGERVYVTGNPIKEVMDCFADRIDAGNALSELGLEEKKYFLVTMHRAENVDVEERLRSLVEALDKLHQRYGFPVVCSFHPRTGAKVEKFGVEVNRLGLRFLELFGFFDFVHLERSAFCTLSDSGTVQEEACIMGVPKVTIGDVTERPETLECGSNLLSGCDPQAILRAVEMVTGQPPPEYLAEHAAATVACLVLGYRLPDLAEQGWQRGGLR